jgi:spore maturation protein CgeB
VKAPKILAVASAVDLDFRYGCTPAWWQLWKGLYEAGCDLIVTPYRGRPIDAPWWRTEPNPCYREAELFAGARDAVARLKRDTHLRRAEEHPPDSVSDRLVRRTIRSWVTPRWRRHLERILERERDVDAVVVFTVPMNHFRGIPTALRERFQLPIVYYDGDVPMSLPEFGGMDTGFNIYHGADPSEYDLVVSNSEGGLGRLRELGARRAEAVFWGADPELFAPLPVAKEHDIFFYGYGDKFRREWMAALVGEPSRRMPEADFALGGRDFRSDVGRARLVGDVPFNAFNRAISASRINLNITRRSHATVRASSTSRPFELASAGAAIVSSPVEGIERWFEPERELVVVQNADEAEEVYRELLADPGAGEELGRRARERVLDEHTYVARARRLLELIGLRVPEAAGLARG